MKQAIDSRPYIERLVSMNEADQSPHVGHLDTCPHRTCREARAILRALETCPDCGHLDIEHEDYDARGDYVARGDASAVTRHVCPSECENENCPHFQE